MISPRSKSRSLVVAGTAGMLAMVPLGGQAFAHGLSAQSNGNVAIPTMRTRQLTSLTGFEAAQYLERNDLIFVPVGPTEQNGGKPMDVEYVIPLALATKMAEKADGLVLPNLTYFYPGGTVTSPGTVHMSPSEGLAYLKAITRSLIRQGFRRIVFVTAHGPSSATMLPLVREVFDETHVPVIWLDSMGIIRAASAGAANQPGVDTRYQFQNLAFGAYQIAGRLEDLPLDVSEPPRPLPQSDTATLLMGALGGGGAGAPLGSFYADPALHGGFVAPMTEQEREERGREGEAMITRTIEQFDIATILQAVEQTAKETRELEEKYGSLLPGEASSER